METHPTGHPRARNSMDGRSRARNDTVLRCSRATARQAMAWLAGHPAALRKDDFPSRNRFRVVVDYAADPEGNYPRGLLFPPSTHTDLHAPIHHCCI